MEFLEPFKVWTDILEAEKCVTIRCLVWPIYIKLNEYLKITAGTDVDILRSKHVSLIEAMKCRGRNYVDAIKTDFEPTIEQKTDTALHPRMKKLKKMDDTNRELTYSNIDFN